MNRKVLIGIIVGAVLIAMMIGILIGDNINSDKKNDIVILTKDNFNEYFTYEISGRWYDGESGDGEIIIAFSPLKNIDLENAEVTISIDENYENTYIYEVIDEKYYEVVTRKVKIPYDGKFSVKFSSYGKNGSGTEYDHCVISWYNFTNYSNAGMPIEKRIDVIVESVNGTIILK